MANFFDLPQEIRCQIYTEVLLVKDPVYIFHGSRSAVRVQMFCPSIPRKWLALLYVNRQVHFEAAATFYSVNRFVFVDTTRRQFTALRSFLDCIGLPNAASISRLGISLPAFEPSDDVSEELTFRSDCIQSLELLQDKCTKLMALEFLVHDYNSCIFTKTDAILLQALRRIEEQLKGILSLRTITVRMEESPDQPSASAREIVQTLGWSMSTGLKK